MQIRIANRQDEKKILQFASEIKLEFTGESDTPESVADLSNIEASYFGHDGVFLLAEEEGKIVAIAGAKMIDEDVLAVRRICVAKDWRAKGIARQLIKVIIPIAQRLLYKQLVYYPAPSCGQTPSAEKNATGFFEALGFTKHISANGKTPFLALRLP